MGCGLSARIFPTSVAPYSKGARVIDGHTWRNTGQMTPAIAEIAGENARPYASLRFPPRDGASPAYAGDTYGDGVTYDCARTAAASLACVRLWICICVACAHRTHAASPPATRAPGVGGRLRPRAEPARSSRDRSGGRLPPTPTSAAVRPAACALVRIAVVL